MEIHPRGNLIWHQTLVISCGSVLLHFSHPRRPRADSEYNGKSLNGLARRKIKNGIFPAHLDFPLPPLSAPRSPRMIFSLQNGRYFFGFYRRSKREARDMGVGERHPHPSPCPERHYRFVLRSTYSAGGLRFLSHVTWKIVGKLRRYLTSFPGCQSSTPNMHRQRRETVAVRCGFTKCLKGTPTQWLVHV